MQDLLISYHFGLDLDSRLGPFDPETCAKLAEQFKAEAAAMAVDTISIICVAASGFI